MNLKIIRRRLWQILEQGNENDKASIYTDIFLITLIILNIVAVVLETVDSIYLGYEYSFLIFERVSTFIFLVEYIIRVWVSVEAIKKKNTLSKFMIRIKYMSTWPAIIDLLAVLSGLKPISLLVEIVDDQKKEIIYSENMDISSSNYISKIHFLISPKNPGIQKYYAEVKSNSLEIVSSFPPQDFLEIAQLRAVIVATENCKKFPISPSNSTQQYPST